MPLGKLKKWWEDRAQNVGSVASRSFDQVNPFDSGRSWQNRTPTAEKAQQSVGGQVRDIFDSNTRADQAKRLRDQRSAWVGTPFRYPGANDATVKDYRAEQQQVMGNARPFTNLGQQLAGNTARTLNTLSALPYEVVGTTRQLAATATNNPEAARNANTFIDRYQDILYQPNSGLLGAGTIFNNRKDMQTIGAADLTKRVGANILGTASETVPMAKVGRVAQGGKVALYGNKAVTGNKAILAANRANSSSKVLPRLGYNVGEGAVTGAGESTARQYANTGKVDLKVLGGDVLANSAMSGALPAAWAGAKYATPTVKKGAKSTVKTAKDIKYKTDKLDPAVRNLDGEYQELNIRWNKSSAQGRKDIEKAIKINRQLRDEITRPGVGFSTRPINPELLPSSNRGNQPKGVKTSDSTSSKSILPNNFNEDAFFERLNAPDSGVSSRSLRRGSSPDPSLKQTPPHTEKTAPLSNNTPEQAQLKDSTAQFSNERRKVVEQYADMLKGFGEGNGVVIREDGSRASNNFRDSRLMGKRMTKQDWLDEAQRQIDTGKAPAEILQAYKELDDPEFRSLVQSEESATGKSTIGDAFTTDPLEGFRVKIKGTSTEKNIPVRKMTKDGDTVTATNVNPNIKAGEKRYSLDKTGDLIEDRKGAYRIFTNDDGHITQVRIGTEVFTPKDFGDLSNVNDYGSSLATMRRNVERAYGKETADKLAPFLVDHQQKQATKMIERMMAMRDGMQKVADELGLNFRTKTKKSKKISAAIQDFGEGNKTNKQLVEEFGSDTANKIVKADSWFRNQYESLLQEMNSILTKYGYEPVEKRKNYYTHFQNDAIWKKFGLKMDEVKNVFSGVTLQDATPEKARGKISNSLAGQSEFTTPNKRFNPFALRREGDTYTSDAFGAFERYLSPTLNNIYMTPSITRARVIAKATAMETDLLGKDANGIVVQTREWANRLAGKSNRWLDRTMSDSRGGRLALSTARWAQKKAGQNTIVGNLGTAVMQPIVQAQAAGKFGYKNTILAAMQEMSTAHAKDAPIRKSEFMKRRYANLDPVTKGKMDTARSIANKPLEVVEETSGRIVWNAAHNDALSKGLKGGDAIRYADVEAEKTLAGRSIGEKPELFESKSLGPITMYQLEVNNYWQQLGKEMTKTQAAKTLFAGYALNLLLQEVTGRQVGFNPVQAAIDSYHIATDEDKDTGEKVKNIAQRGAGEVVDNVPIVAPLASAGIGDKKVRNLLGEQSNTGRFGVASPISALTSTTDVGLPVNVPQNLILPFGGSQVKKTIDAAKALNKGYSETPSGSIKFPVDMNSPRDVVQGLGFGQYATEGGKKYTSGEIKSLTKDQSEQYRDLPPEARERFLKIVADRKNNKKGIKVASDGYVEKGGKLIKLADAPLKDRVKLSLDALEKGEIDGEEVKNAVKLVEPKLKELEVGGQPIKIDTRNAIKWGKFQDRLDKGKVNPLNTDYERRKLQAEIYEDQHMRGATGDVFRLGKSSDAGLREALEAGRVSQEDFEKALAFDNWLVKHGLRSSSAIGKKLRKDYGYDPVYAEGKEPSSKGKGRSKKKGSGIRTVKLSMPKVDTSPIKLSKYSNAPNVSTALPIPGIKIAPRRANIRLKAKKI